VMLKMAARSFAELVSLAERIDAIALVTRSPTHA
jgi:hypothetical protein